MERGTWERETCERGTCERETCERGTWNVGTGNVRTWEQACKGGDTGARARPHSFIRFPFVDRGDGTWNVERGNGKRANVECVPTLEVSAGETGLAVNRTDGTVVARSSRAF